MDETGKKMKNKLSILILLGCVSLSFAHVGSLNVFYEGKAGTYPIRKGDGSTGQMGCWT